MGKGIDLALAGIGRKDPSAPIDKPKGRRIAQLHNLVSGTKKRIIISSFVAGLVVAWSVFGLILSPTSSPIASIHDSDVDGHPDSRDAFPQDPNEWKDTDKDGVGDNSDEFPNDSNESRDSDGDGHGDNSDAFPNDPQEWADSDGDGHGDNQDTYPDNRFEWADTDGDGFGDNQDVWPLEAWRWEHSRVYFNKSDSPDGNYWILNVTEVRGLPVVSEIKVLPLKPVPGNPNTWGALASDERFLSDYASGSPIKNISWHDVAMNTTIDVGDYFVISKADYPVNTLFELEEWALKLDKSVDRDVIGDAYL